MAFCNCNFKFVVGYFRSFSFCDTGIFTLPSTNFSLIMRMSILRMNAFLKRFSRLAGAYSRNHHDTGLPDSCLALLGGAVGFALRKWELATAFRYNSIQNLLDDNRLGGVLHLKL